MRTPLAFLLLAACAPEDFPGDPVFSDPARLEVQPIAPLDPILAQAAEADATAETEAELAARGSTLRERADALRSQPR